jgi:hypothetical protein
VIPIEVLRTPAQEATATILARARSIEGRRAERTLTEADVWLFLACVQKRPTDRVRVYAQRGAFAPKNQKLATPITVLEYTPADEHGPAQMSVSETDARRPHGRGRYVECDWIEGA